MHFLEAQKNEKYHLKSLSLSLLQEKGLSYFSIFDIRSTQAFLSAHLQGSFHAKDEGEIIESLRISHNYCMAVLNQGVQNL